MVSDLHRNTHLDLSIILPTYNECGNICDLIDAINREMAQATIDYEILVVDDNSPDGTADVVRQRYPLARAQDEAMADDPAAGREPGLEQVRLIVRTANKGLANSIRDGIEQARGQTLVVMDTDFNHDPAMIPQMVDFLRYYDLVIGSRFVMRGGMEDKNRYRLSMIYNMFIRFALNTQIHDNLSGFFAVRQERLHQLQPKFDSIFYGYGDYFIRLLLMAWRTDWKILEVPVFYILRRHGTSKTGFWRTFVTYTAAVLRLRVKRQDGV